MLVIANLVIGFQVTNQPVLLVLQLVKLGVLFRCEPAVSPIPVFGLLNALLPGSQPVQLVSGEGALLRAVPDSLALVGLTMIHTTVSTTVISKCSGGGEDN